MAIIFDIVAVGLIALSIFIGYKQGLIKAGIKILSFFIAIIVALILYKPISNIIINNTSIDDNIKNTMIEKILPEGSSEDEEVEIGDSISSKLLEGASNTIEEIANSFTVKLIEIITILLIFIIVKIALKFISKLTDIITKLPILKQVNKLGGTIYGIIRGFIFVYTILAVVYLISPLLNNNVRENIDNSFITKALYNNNLILNILI